MTEKVYLENPYLKDLPAKIVKKEYSNGKFYITLNRTIFYPHMSGGQPRDIGTINNVKVLDVYEDGNDIVHVLEDNIQDKVKLSINWNARFDHMQQHTGQHILSAAFHKLYNAETVGFHIGKDYVYIDITLPSLKESDINKIERYANEIIFANFDIKSYIVNKDEISKLPLRKKTLLDTNIRIVEIDGIDYSPCAGTHHRSTGEVGLIKIRKWEKYKGNTRVEFVCGNRALKDYSWKNLYINKISNLLSVKDIDCLDSVNKLINENKTLFKEIRALKEEIFQYESKELLNEAFNYKGVKIVKKVFSEISFKEIKNIASNILNNDNAIILFGLKEKEKGQILLGRSQNLNINILEIFNSIIGIIEGRGGGNSQLVQGGGARSEKIIECIDAGFELIIKKI